jgi:hypothetical protein
MNQIIQMIINQFIRQFMDTAVNKGIEVAARRGKPEDQLTAKDHEQAARGKDLAQRAKDIANMMRRI